MIDPLVVAAASASSRLTLRSDRCGWSTAGMTTSGAIPATHVPAQALTDVSRR